PRTPPVKRRAVTDGEPETTTGTTRWRGLPPGCGERQARGGAARTGDTLAGRWARRGAARTGHAHTPYQRPRPRRSVGSARRGVRPCVLAGGVGVEPEAAPRRGAVP